MRMYDIIKKKRDGGVLTREEIQYFVNGYVAGAIPDYQAAAFLMAIYFRKLDKEETVILTEVMAQSGDRIDLSAIPGIKVDKHSTGGVGDKTSLVLAPLAAAAGIPVAKMSGRGLGHTGGTIDKLEAIPGFRAEMGTKEFIDSVKGIGIALTGQTGDIAPADKRMYALRDVTATVDNISLIASSIMSKKLAAGADAILLDVKVGRGAFMKDIDGARELAAVMVDIGVSAGRKTAAVISDMNQPLGYAVGNALEVKEAIDTIKGNGPEDFELLCRELGAAMLVMGRKAESMDRGRRMVEHLISTGRAAEKFAAFVQNQGGDPGVVEAPEEILPKAGRQMEILSDSDGFIGGLYAEEIGLSAMLLGAGRAEKEDRIDPAVGIVLHKKIGDPVRKGESIATFHIGGEDNLKNAMKLFKSAVKIAERPVVKPEIIIDRINMP